MATRDEVKAGIVIALSLVILAGLILGVSGVSLWERYDRYTVRLRSTAGLDEGAPVRLGGLRVGRVLHLEIPREDTSLVEITLGVRQGTAIPQGTWASVATLGLLGDTYLQLTTESHSDQRIPPGSRIPGREAATVADLLQRLQGVVTRTDTVLGEVGIVLNRDVAEMMRRLNEIAEATQKTVAHIDDFVAPANRQRVEQILATLDQTVRESAGSIRVTLDHLSLASRRMETTIESVDGLVQENRADLREAVRLLRADLEKTGDLLAGLDQTLGSVRQALGHVDEAVVDNREGLDETLADLRRGAQNLRELTQSLKERPWNVLFPAPAPEKPGLDSRR